MREIVSAIFSCKVERPAPQRQSTRLSYQHNSDMEPENGYLPHRGALQILAQSLEKHGGRSRA
jgi:hypothetical protein